MPPLPKSEPHVSREVNGPPAEIDLVGEEVLVEQTLALGLLVAELSTDRRDVANREPDATENHRTDRGAAADEPVGEGEALGVDELADLAVAPVECADAGADVRL